MKTVTIAWAMAPSQEPARRRRKSVRLLGLLYQTLISPLAIEAATQPSVAAIPAAGARTMSASRGMASSTATGASAAASLARITVEIGAGLALSRSGASSAETVIQDRLPLTWPAMKA